MIRVMSCNIRTSLAEDGENGWDLRRDLCLQTVLSRSPDVVCFQEMTADQSEFMLLGMGRDPEGFARVGSPDRPFRRDPLNSIFFRRSRFTLLHSGHFWLSRTPYVPGSKLRGSKYPRYASWVLLRPLDAETGTGAGTGAAYSADPLLIVNTHLDHIGQAGARAQQVAVLTSQISRLARRSTRRATVRSVGRDAMGTPGLIGPVPFQLLAGDMNADDRSEELRLFLEAGFSDTFSEATENGGTSATSAGSIEGVNAAASCHGFKGEEAHSTLGRIDWILSRGDGRIALDAEIVRDSDDGRFPSDHYFITADLWPAPRSR